jgi:asperthecin polyketide synthase
MHRLAIVTAYEALEMSGYSPNRTPSTNTKRIGIYYGQASDDWREVNTGQNICTYGVPGTERAFANGRINYFFGFGGPSFNIDTACSSGLAAVNAACSALWAGEADTVLAGGLNVITNCDNYCGLSRGHFLSKTGQCKVWDKDADGYCRADGIVSMVIKRLEDAEADNDNVLGVICAAATNHSAEAISITHPHAGAQMENYSQVMASAGVSPLDVSYVELHGTGTQAGDAVESESVAGIFAPRGQRRRPEQRLHLGAVKSNVGHSEAAAGITSLLKVLLMYQKNQIPPHVGIKTEMNPVVVKNLEQRNAGLVFENIPWPKPKDGKKRYALVNSFGAHGGNTTLLLEDAPERPRVGEYPCSTHVFTLSAKSKNSLRANTEALLRYLGGNPDTAAGDLSYTLCARRIHHATRISTSASSIPQLRKFLELSLETDKLSGIRPVSSTAPSVVMAFTGQGAYYEGISKQLYQHFPAYRSEIHQLDCLVQKMGFPSLVPFIDNNDDTSASGVTGDADQPEQVAPSPLITQLCILVVEIALTRFWKLLGVVPDAVVGHSLGEYAAMVAGGVLAAADAIYLVARRAQLMAEHCVPGSHAMLSVRASVETVEECVGTTWPYDVSCRNGREDTVISGTRQDIDAIRSALEIRSIKAVLLDVPYAFHTAQLDPILSPFEEAASHVTFKAPSIPIISPLLQDCVFDGKTINAHYLRRASREPVLFVNALDAAHELGIFDDKSVWIDVGPHPVCSSLVRSWAPGARAYASVRRKEDNFATLAATLSELHLHGVPVCWNEYFRPHEMSLRMVNLKPYQWNEKDYWIQYGGTWSLDKFYYAQGKEPPHKPRSGAGGQVSIFPEASLRTSSVHQIVSEEVFDSRTRARLTAFSDLKHPSLLPATRGHLMNGYGVATNVRDATPSRLCPSLTILSLSWTMFELTSSSQSIWTDISLTIGEYLYKLLVAITEDVHMNVGNSEVLHAQVVDEQSKKAHLVQIRAELDLSARRTIVKFHHLASDAAAEEQQQEEEAFASFTVWYESPESWRREWQRVDHLVRSRADELGRLASAGEATRLNRSMAYTLFGNVVDYAAPYQGMQSVVLAGWEAVADITLAPDDHGVWHSAPHYNDSVCHIGGLVLNAGDATDARDFFYVTPGFGSYRMLNRLRPGDSYRSYVRMERDPAEPNMFAGDIYILQDGKIVGMCGEIRFRRVPRKLMHLFFSPSNPATATVTAMTTMTKKESSAATTDISVSQKPMTIAATVPGAATSRPAQTALPLLPSRETLPIALPVPLTTHQPPRDEPPSSKAADAADSQTTPAQDSNPTLTENSVVTACLLLICRESGLSIESLHDDATFVELGIDSLMSLVLSEKFKSELQLDVKSSLFLECPNIGALKEWLNEYC